jgi:hypothetical protein
MGFGDAFSQMMNKVLLSVMSYSIQLAISCTLASFGCKQWADLPVA